MTNFEGTIPHICSYIELKPKRTAKVSEAKGIG
jgi:hypothetical protein